MARGSPTITIRVPEVALSALQEEIARTNKNIRVQPFTISSWVLTAIWEKLDKSQRSRKRRKPKNGPIMPDDKQTA